jgi:hypothetical protein
MFQIYGESPRGGMQMFTLLVIIILLAVIWTLLKLLAFTIKLPFKVLGFIFRQPFATIFWLVVAGYVVYYFFIH